MGLLGKTLKGRSTQAGEGDAQPARNVRTREVILNQAQYEAEKAQRLLKESHFRQLVQEEERIYAINRKKLLTNWRKILRVAKTEELKKELEIYSQSNHRELDSLEAYIQMLDKNIDEAEDQYNLAMRNHLIQIDKLFEIRDSRIDALREEFLRASRILYDEYNREALEIRQTHIRQKKELEDMMETIRAEENEKQTLASDSHQTQTEQLKQKAKEEIEQMQGEMTSKQNTLSNELESLFQRYTNDTKDRFNEHLTKVNESNKVQNKISKETKKIAKTKERIDFLDIKTRQMEQELWQKNLSLSNEKAAISANFLDLKNKMLNFRAKERKKLTELVLNSKIARENLEDVSKLGEKILKTAELCRRLETEKEKVLPFYDSTVTDEDIPVDLQVIYKEVSEQESKSYGYIKNYFKRYNKVMLDKIAIQQQRDLYKKENLTLKNLLKQYIDNISINDDVMANYNPLLIVDRAKLEQVPVEQISPLVFGRGNFIEANEEVDHAAKHNS